MLKSQIWPSASCLDALAWTPEGHCRCLVKNKTPHQNSNFMPPTSPENELLDPKIEKSPTCCKFQNFDPQSQLNIKFLNQ